MRIPHQRQDGQVLIMVALSAVVLIASVGLAVDSALGYFVKAKLNAAVDSASLAAARGVTAGSSEEDQRANARQSAEEFFDINYPDQFLLSTPTLHPVGVVFDKGTVTIDVSATASLPVSLMGILGFKTLNVAASAQTIRKDLDMMLVMDTSGSLASNADAVRAAGKSFLNKFNSTVDRVGFDFASKAQIVSDQKVEPVRPPADQKGGKIVNRLGRRHQSSAGSAGTQERNDIGQVNAPPRGSCFFRWPLRHFLLLPNTAERQDGGRAATFKALQSPAWSSVQMA